MAVASSQHEVQFTQQFGPNLIYELDFLQNVDSNPWLSDNNVIRNAVRRYERCWLPLIAEAGDLAAESLAPPLDVHWVWHCHMLSPYNYERDCTFIVGKVIDHSVRPRDQLEKGQQSAEAIWKERYPGEAFFPLEDAVDVDHERLSEYDLEAATRRQSKFFYNVSLPHYWNDKFLAIAVDRYKKFINLKKSTEMLCWFRAMTSTLSGTLTNCILSSTRRTLLRFLVACSITMTLWTTECLDQCKTWLVRTRGVFGRTNIESRLPSTEPCIAGNLLAVNSQ